MQCMCVVATFCRVLSQGFLAQNTAQIRVARPEPQAMGVVSDGRGECSLTTPFLTSGRATNPKRQF